MYGSSSSLYSSYGSSASQLNAAYGAANNIVSWSGPALIISIIAAVVVFFLFLSKKNEGKFTGFVGWLYDFLDFKKLSVEAILKICYIAFALYITIMSFSIIGANFLGFLMILVGGNILLRVIYELLLIQLIICKNTTEINKKMSNKQ